MVRRSWWLLVLAACGGGTAAPDAAVGDGAVAPDAREWTDVTVTVDDLPADRQAYGFLVAYQDGDQAWGLAPDPVGSTFTLPITTNRWAVAWTCITDARRVVAVAHYTLGEKTDLHVRTADPVQCTDARRLSSLPITGTVAGAHGQPVVVFAGRAFALADQSGAFHVDVVDPAVDLVVARFTSGPLTDLGRATVDRIAVRRTGDGAGAIAIDLDAEGAAPEVVTATVGAPAPGDQTVVQSILSTANGTRAVLGGDRDPPFALAGLPASLRAPGDGYVEEAAIDAGPAALLVETGTDAPADVSFQRPAALVAPVVTLLPSPRIGMRSTWLAPYPGAAGYRWVGTETIAGCGAVGTCTITWDQTYSSGWLGAAIAIEPPDLSSVAGWDPRAELVHGGSAKMTATAVAGPTVDVIPVGPRGEVVPAAGVTRATATVDYAFDL